MLNLVEQSYNAGWYTLDNVKTFVIAGMITKEEYKQITGQDYDAVADSQPAQYQIWSPKKYTVREGGLQQRTKELKT